MKIPRKLKLAALGVLAVYAVFWFAVGFSSGWVVR